MRNDVLRRLRYVFDFSDSQMISLFGLGGLEVTRAEVSDWLKKDDDPSFKPCSDHTLAYFLNGLIIEKRGAKEGPKPVAEQELTNNNIFMKIKIALNLKAEDVLEILRLDDFTLSPHELSAFFRKPGHKHYRECQDQVLRNFIFGLQKKFRGVVQPEEE